MTTALLAAAAVAAGALAPDPPGIVLHRVAAPTHVAARGGVAVFGAFDPATRATTLMRRDRAGAIGPVGVLPIPLPAFAGDRRGGPGGPPSFEVTLGIGPRGGLVATYIRCPAPARASCRLAFAELATGTERLIPGTGRALRGAVWGSRVVLVRRDRDGIQRLYATTTGRSGDLRRLRLPRLDPTVGDGTPIDRRQVQIAAVDVRGDDVAYVVNYPLTRAGELASSDLWLNRSDRPPRLVARVRTGGASSGFRELVGPRLSSRSIVVFRQARDQGNGVQRWSLGGRLLGAGSIGLRGDHEVTGGTYDHERLYFATNAYQGSGCAAFDQPPAGASCPVLDSGRLVLRPPAA